MIIRKSMLALIISSMFAQSTYLVDWNIDLNLDAGVDGIVVSHREVINNHISISPENINKLLYSGLIKNEDPGKTKLESIDNYLSNSYNQASIILADFTYPLQKEEERSDLFYYILGIIILIISMFILRQRYREYLKERDKLNS